MTRPISDLDVPLPRLEQQIRDLVERQRAATAADRSAARLRAFLTPTDVTATPEEGK
jgi:hypothetical protein